MGWKLLGIAVMCYQVITPSFGCNESILDSEAHAINSKLSLHQHVSVDEIRDSFHFVYNESDVNYQYKQPVKFLELYEQMMKEVEGPFSKEFVQRCKQVYETEGSTLKTKISTHLLLEKVREKYLALIHLIKKQESPRKEEPQLGEVSHADKDLFKAFFGTDMAPISSR